MGGFIRSIARKVFRKPKQVVIQQQAPVQATKQTAKADGKTAQALAASKSGKYGTSTIMNEASGVEEEANVSKTALGGQSIKKKKKYA
jgi:hypothetical protein